MIAYLIGGPSDLVKLYVKDSAGYLSFPHSRPLPVPRDQEPAIRAPVEVENVSYRKVYENIHAAIPYSVYVYVESWK